MVGAPHRLAARRRHRAARRWSRTGGWIAALVLCLGLAAGVAAASPGGEPAVVQARAAISYALEVTLEPAARTLHGRADIRVEDGAGFELILDRRFTLTTLVVDGRPLSPTPAQREPHARWRLPPGPAPRVISVAWQGALAPLPVIGQHRDTLGVRTATADLRGSFLPAGSLWYPRAVRDGRALPHAYQARIDVPAGQHGVVAGTLVAERIDGGRRISHFEFPHPGEGVDLIAGPYRIGERTMASIDGRRLVLRSYFHDEIAALADAYLEAVAGHVALYEDWIGPYPYTRFSVISSPTPTGFAMPTLTYLGIDVLRLPFIRDGALGHEVLHNWWGNGVYPDYARGNWSEGLTTFMADYADAVRRGPQAARAMRLGWLRELSGIPAGTDRPLAEFTARHHGVSQAIGYGKAAMLFVMLRERIGGDAFDRGVRRFWRQYRFRTADWDDLRAAFEAESGQALQRFFAQWLTRPGLPEVRLEAAVGDAGETSVTLVQTEPAYELDMPLHVEGADGAETLVVRLDAARQSIDLAAGVRRVSLDPDHLLLRRLATDEAPPILRELLFDRRSTVIALGGPPFADATEALIARLFDRPPLAGRADRAPAHVPLLVVGPDDALARWLARHDLPPPPAEVTGRGDVRMWTLRRPSGAALAVIAARDAAALEQAVRRLPHYGQQSWLVIDGGGVVARGVWPARVPSLAVGRD
jgi:hypothetical protein